MLLVMGVVVKDILLEIVIIETIEEEWAQHQFRRWVDISMEEEEHRYINIVHREQKTPMGSSVKETCRSI